MCDPFTTLWRTRLAGDAVRCEPVSAFPLPLPTGKLTGNFCRFGPLRSDFPSKSTSCFSDLRSNSLSDGTGNSNQGTGNFLKITGKLFACRRAERRSQRFRSTRPPSFSNQSHYGHHQSSRLSTKRKITTRYVISCPARSFAIEPASSCERCSKPELQRGARQGLCHPLPDFRALVPGEITAGDLLAIQPLVISSRHDYRPSHVPILRSITWRVRTMPLRCAKRTNAVLDAYGGYQQNQPLGLIGAVASLTSVE